MALVTTIEMRFVLVCIGKRCKYQDLMREPLHGKLSQEVEFCSKTFCLLKSIMGIKSAFNLYLLNGFLILINLDYNEEYSAEFELIYFE
jgi:hypothetical protein